jgi:hypothetical protein
MQCSINFKEIPSGTGKMLYIVTGVASERPYETGSYLHLADDEDHLFNQLLSEFINDYAIDIDDEEEVNELTMTFNDIWGNELLVFEVGNIVE